MEVVKAWLAFGTDLVKLQEFMRINLTNNYTGLSCCPVYCRFVFNSTIDQSDLDIIDAYWNELNEIDENASILDRTEAPLAIIWKKSSLVYKIWKDMTITERKLILEVALSNEELSALLTEYRAQ